MNMDNYQQVATRTFKPHNTDTISEEKLELMDWCLGLGGECGEVLDLAKHTIFHNEPMNKPEMAKELGDVLWYLTAICETIGIPLAVVAKLNEIKLTARYSGGAYSDAASADRKSKEELIKGELERLLAIYAAGGNMDEV